MKKLLLLLLLAFQFTASKAQSWVYHPFPSGNDSAIWIQQHANSEGSIYFWRTYLYGDTILGSNNYKKLYRTSVNAMVYPPPTPPFFHPYNFIGGLREDIPAKKVYYYEAFTGTETLLYDFSLTVGDTAYVDFSHSDTVVYTISGIDSILVDSVYHKRLLLQPSGFGSEPGNWIEGVGSEAGPLDWFVMGFEFSHTLACFGVNNINKYYYEVWPPAPECSFSVGIGEFENNSISLVVTPNPTSGIISLSVTCTELLSLEILDVSGKVLLSSRSSVSSGSIIDLSEFPKGVYFARLSDSKGNNVSKRIVKN